MTNVAILLSGRGSNFMALADSVASGEIPAEICLVVSNVDGAPGIVEAEARGLATRTIPNAGESSWQAHEAKVLAALTGADADWICLAGYMRKLSADFVARYRHRILNIHPSLLPSFPGLDVHEQTLEHGVKISGCTVHFVDEDLDAGPIVVQRAVRMAEDDTADTLAARILEQEHEAYPEALRRLLTEEWELVGRTVVFREQGAGNRE